MSALHVFLIDDGGETFWWVARDNEDAYAQFEKHPFAGDMPVARDKVSITRFADDYPLTLIDADDDEVGTTKTCAEWCKKGRGMLATSIPT